MSNEYRWVELNEIKKYIPTYRPFKSLEEFIPYSDKWVTRKGTAKGISYKITGIDYTPRTPYIIYIFKEWHSLQAASDKFDFIDLATGITSPFGITE